MADRYTYQIAWSDEDSEYVGACAEFPSLSWLAPSPDEAFAGIRQAVADCVEDMRACGEPLPEAAGERGGGEESAASLRIPSGV